MSKFNKVGQFLSFRRPRFYIISNVIIRSISLSNANILVVISFRINTNFIQFFFSACKRLLTTTSFYLILIHFIEMYIRLQNKYHWPTETSHVLIDPLVQKIHQTWQRVTLKLIELTTRKDRL